MTEWATVRFADLASGDRWAFSIGPFGSKVTTRDYLERGVPFIRGVNLSRGVFYDDEFVFISDEKSSEVESAVVKSGDLIFTRKGTIGQVSMIPRQARFGRYVISGSQVKARLDANMAHAEFYLYWFLSPFGRQALLAHAVTTGVPSLANSLNTLRNLKVPCPPLSEQQAIAGVLGALDDKIAINDRIAGTYEQLLKLQMEQLGVGDDPDPSRAICVTELVEFNPKLPKPSAEDAIYVDMAALSTDRAGIGAWARRDPKGGTRFANGDTLMARITPCLENGKTGYVDFMKDGEIGMGSTEFIIMRSRPGVPKEFSYFLARSERFREHAMRNMVGSSGRQRVSAADAANFYIIRPDSEALAAFGEAASTAFVRLKALGNESRTLAALRDTLLPQLMSGKLCVRDAERILEDAV